MKKRPRPDDDNDKQNNGEDGDDAPPNAAPIIFYVGAPLPDAYIDANASIDGNNSPQKSARRKLSF